MINKVIHYCWFGGKEKPESAKKCIESWKKYCKDYEIKEWNESNFDLNCNQYVKEAYENKKWAFITDYVRLYALYNFGGVYMDTDVELLRNIDVFLSDPGFSGFENDTDVPTGVMASEKGNRFIGLLMDYYKDKHFIKKDGSFDLTTNVETITRIAKEHGLVQNNQYQHVLDYVFYPKDYFCPKDSTTLELHITKNTYMIHHFAGSWVPQSKFRNFVKKILGPKLSRKISRLIRKK